MPDRDWDRKTRTTWSTKTRRPSGAPQDSSAFKPFDGSYDQLLTRFIEREHEAIRREAQWRTYLYAGGAALGGVVIGLSVPYIVKAMSDTTREPGGGA